ncbi:TRAP transporter large permease [Bacillus sp. B15-48]|uniref:TRAP transporter large permease n=1 Tax=Bacillus sp. B15-48 TaxID=1548601 RepID=UPI00193F960A|nr:TRAP transporter large permease [Bacillus sp. B15-48]MBM4764695.1 TRAP transporter large permease subunit [Bacillus sp. B15-48]
MIVVIAFFVLLLIGVPIAFVLGLSTLVGVLVTDNFTILGSMPSRMMNGLQNFGLVAIPLFVLLGEVMNHGGITQRLINFAKTIFGHFRGGLAYVNIAANMFLSSIIGSSAAQTAIMGQVMVPAMEKEGYKRDFSTALTTASSIVGPLIPPSVPFIIYGVTAGVSIGGLFLAGIVPGVLFSLAFGIYIYFVARKENMPKLDRAPLNQAFKDTLMVLPALFIPVVILVGITSGIFTATESAAFAIFIALIVGFFLYRDLKIKHLWQIFLNACVTSSIVTFLLATANIFGYIIAYEKVPERIAEIFLALADGPLMFLLLSNILLLVVGLFIDSIVALILLVPILLPIAITYGVDPIHFGVIVVLNLTLGLMTPPVGAVLFIASSITKVKIEQITAKLIPFIIISLIILLLITYVPSISLYIPKLFL